MKSSKNKDKEAANKKAEKSRKIIPKILIKPQIQI